MTHISSITLACPTFTNLLKGNGGYLPREPGSQALWYYYTLARKNYEEQRNPIVLVGDKDPTYNYKQLYTNIAAWYGVDPEQMSWFWDYVDKQARALNLPLLPHHLRFKGIVIKV